MTSKKPNILVLWGDDIGYWNISFNNRGMMGYRTPNIDRLAQEGVGFTAYYEQQSCTAGRACFITGQNPERTGLTKVGVPGADIGLRPDDPTVAELLKPLGYATGQFWKEPPGRQGRVLAVEPWIRRVLRQSVPPERGRRAGEPGLSQGPSLPEALRAARCHPQFRGRPHRRHRAAHQEADGDHRRRGHQARDAIHGGGPPGARAVLPLVELAAHALSHAREEGLRRPDRPRHLHRRDC